MQADRQELEKAYRATAYRVAGLPDLRIGTASPALDQLLRRHAADSWAYLTAYNPGSELRPTAENEVRLRELRTALTHSGFVFLDGEGVGSGWPAEPSFLVIGITLADAVQLGRRFGQAAVVVGELGTSARLIWLADETL
jgi:hypothetical protein